MKINKLVIPYKNVYENNPINFFSEIFNFSNSYKNVYLNNPINFFFQIFNLSNTHQNQYQNNKKNRPNLIVDGFGFEIKPKHKKLKQLNHTKST